MATEFRWALPGNGRGDEGTSSTTTMQAPGNVITGEQIIPSALLRFSLPFYGFSKIGGDTQPSIKHEQ